MAAALADLEQWLGKGQNGAAWAAYLHLDQLQAALEKGAEADQATIDGVVKQLDSGAPGLELPKFRALRAAIATWADDLDVAKAGGLPEAALASEGKYEPISGDDVTGSKAALEAASAKLGKYLTGDNGKKWREYLRFDALEQQLQSATPDVEALGGVYQRFTADHVGLEMPVFADVATALDRYISAVAAAAGDAKEQFATQIKSLSDELKQYSQAQSEELASAIGGRLGWLERMRQARGLVRAVRREYSHPNLFVAASARLVTAGLEQDVDDTGPVSDFILGTDISGTGHTKGKVTARLVPSDDRATIEVLLNGHTQTRTVGYNGPATIYSKGEVDISGSKRIILDASGFKSYTAVGTAHAKTKTTGIGAKHKLVQRIATRRVAEQKSEAERIASAHAGVRVGERVDAQSGEQLSKAHWDYLSQVRQPLVRRREFPELLQFRTTDKQLLVTGLKANRMQLAAPNDPPAVDGEFDLVVRLHETMVNNMAAAVLAGVTLKEEEVQKKVIELRGELPEKLKSEEDRDPWSITFAAIKPVTITFADNGFKLTIRGQRYTSGERDFRAMNVTAEYKMEIDGPGAKLVRQGDLVVLPPNFVPGKSRLSSQQISWQTTLKRRFGKFLEPEIKSEGLELPGNWAKAGRLDLKVLNSSTGWLALAWLESGVPVKDKKSDKPQEKVALANPEGHR
ncbi:MAG: hypothetical protein AB7U76_12970 [Pirellulales bacterium]